VIRTTDAQKSEIREVIKSDKFYSNEKVWTFLVADILSTSYNRNYYIELFCDRGIELDLDPDIWFEAMPLSPRTEKSGNPERTHVDLAFGNIKKRGNTGAGIEFYQNKKESWVCFVEAKLDKDVSTGTTHDDKRNQIIRIIDNLICFQKNGQFPQKLFFALLTPRSYRDKTTEKLYGSLIKRYKNPKHIRDDILRSRIPERHQPDWNYPDDLEDRIKLLKITWVTYEEIFEKEYEIRDHDLATRKMIPEKIENRLNELGDSIITWHI
jgi:hypothetical protein